MLEKEVDNRCSSGFLYTYLGVGRIKMTIKPKLNNRKTISFEHKHNVTAVNLFDFSINWYSIYLIRHNILL